MSDRPLLMIPGPVEVSARVRRAYSVPPPSHLAPAVIEAFGAALEKLRHVWLAAPDSQPFVVAGSGTLAMDMAAANLLEAGERALVVNSGYFSDRMAEMLRRQGAEVSEVRAAVGEAPEVEEVARALAEGAPFKALFATHVDTSTGVRVAPEPLARLASEHGALSVFDGVCATAGEEFRMAEWGADVYFTASQKAIGLPPGLALAVVSPRALEARRERRGAAPAMILDWLEWLPVLRAYEERRPSYFSTPATHHLLALDVGLGEILEGGMEARFAHHRRAATALRGIWGLLGLELVPREKLAANTLSALYFPPGLGAALIAAMTQRGVVVAGGLHAEIRERYFRVGHMGYSVTRPDHLRRAALAVGGALADLGREIPADFEASVARAFPDPDDPVTPSAEASGSEA